MAERLFQEEVAYAMLAKVNRTKPKLGHCVWIAQHTSHHQRSSCNCWTNKALFVREAGFFIHFDASGFFFFFLPLSASCKPFSGVLLQQSTRATEQHTPDYRIITETDPGVFQVGWNVSRKAMLRTYNNNWRDEYMQDIHVPSPAPREAFLFTSLPKRDFYLLALCRHISSLTTQQWISIGRRLLFGRVCVCVHAFVGEVHPHLFLSSIPTTYFMMPDKVTSRNK